MQRHAADEKQGRTVSGEYIWKVRDDDAWAEAWPE
jgi:hypothetical protein